MRDILIRGGRIIDPANNLDDRLDILIENGRIYKVDKNLKSNNAEVIEADKKIIIPGLIDMHTHLRQPGREDEETIVSGSLAASKGGFTAVAAMPNTDPPMDNESAVEFVLSLSRKAGLIKLYPVGAMTRGLKGEQLSEIGSLVRSGVVAISNDGNPVASAEVMRRALEYSKMYSIAVISHCEDRSLSGNGVMNEGFVSTRFGFKGIPSVAESIIVSRDIQLAHYAKARLHIAHVSTRDSVDIIREARRKGIEVTSETCPQYWTLTDEDARLFDTNTKMNPPLRTKEDVDSIKEALKDGTIDVISTDHAPHASWEKENPWDDAPFGIIGLETALGLVITELVEPGIIDWAGVVKTMSIAPARILGVQDGTLSIGKDADVTIINPDKEWTVNKEEFLSKSNNSPFIGWRLKGVVEWTISRGKIVWRQS